MDKAKILDGLVRSFKLGWIDGYLSETQLPNINGFPGIPDAAFSQLDQLADLLTMAGASPTDSGTENE